MLLSCAVLLFVNVVGYVVLVDLELSVKADILLRHGERAVYNGYVSRLPTLKGIAFLRGNLRTYGYISADSVLLSCAVLLVVNVVGYVVLADLELSVKADIILRHGERAVFNGYVVCRPTRKGIAFLRGNRSTYGYIIADSVLLSCVVLLLTVNVIGYVELILNPLCIQV